jgi:hypothetical protein
MPVPSKIAKRLAEDLKEVGSAYGYISNVEYPPSDNSSLKFDVAWELEIEKNHKYSILPGKMITVSIEIQYSNQPHSNSDSVLKAKYANSPYHIIISYEKISESNRKMWESQFPDGKELKIIEGKEEVEDLQLWVSYILNNHKEDLEETNSKMY